MAKLGEERPWRVRFQFEGQKAWVLGNYHSREAAEFQRDRQADRVGPNGETCEAWVEHKEHGRVEDLT